MDKPFGKQVFRKDVTVQTRLTVVQDDSFAAAVRETCKAIPELRACYLLDARREDSPDIALFMALSLDDPKTQMDGVAARFQEMLKAFPTYAKRSFILSAEGRCENYKGREFYLRK